LLAFGGVRSGRGCCHRLCLRRCCRSRASQIQVDNPIVRRVNRPAPASGKDDLDGDDRATDLRIRCRVGRRWKLPLSESLGVEFRVRDWRSSIPDLLWVLGHSRWFGSENMREPGETVSEQEKYASQEENDQNEGAGAASFLDGNQRAIVDLW